MGERNAAAAVAWMNHCHLASQRSGHGHAKWIKIENLPNPKYFNGLKI